MNARRLDLNWLLVAGLCLFAVGPFLTPGYFWGAHDARSHIYFLFEYHRAIADGILWPRWAPDFTFGYGYPFFNVYGALSTALAEIILLLGFGYTGAVEAVFVLSIVGSGLAMYGFVRGWAGRTAGLVAAVAYVYVPYHLFDLYVRAALAEALTFVFLPLILWALRAAVQRPRWRAIAALAVAYGGAMFSNNLVTFVFTLIVVAPYVLLLALAQARADLPGAPLLSFMGHTMRRLLPPALGLALGLTLSAVYWLPAISEFQYVRQDQWYEGRYDYRDDFVYLHQLFSPRWGFGASEAGPDDDAGFGLGLAPLALALLGLGVAWRRKGSAFAYKPIAKGNRRRQADVEVRQHLWLFWLVLLAGVFLTLPLSSPLWALGFIRSAQFPWRYLILTSVALPVLSAAVVAGRERVTLLGVGLALLLLLGSYPYLQVQIQEPAEGPVSYAGLMRYQQSADEMTGSTAWVQRIPDWSPLADAHLRGEAVTSKVDYSQQDDKSLIVGSVGLSTIHEEVYFLAEAEGKRVTFLTFYYPGWRAYLLDGMHGRIAAELPIEPQGELGLISIAVPPGEGYLLVRFEDTPVRIVGKWLSVGTLAVLALGALARRVWRR